MRQCLWSKEDFCQVFLDFFGHSIPCNGLKDRSCFGKAGEIIGRHFIPAKGIQLQLLMEVENVTA